MIQIKLLKKQRLTDLENKHGFLGKRWEPGIPREFGTDMYTLLYLKMDN